MHHEGRLLSRELVVRRSAERARRYARIKRRCPGLATGRPFLATSRPRFAMLCPFLPMHRPLPPTRRAFAGHRHPKRAPRRASSGHRHPKRAKLPLFPKHRDANGGADALQFGLNRGGSIRRPVIPRRTSGRFVASAFVSLAMSCNSTGARCRVCSTYGYGEGYGGRYGVCSSERELEHLEPSEWQMS
jgi:hypothetical protein